MQLSISTPRRIIGHDAPGACYYGCYLQKRTAEQPGSAEEMMLTQGGYDSGIEFGPSDPNYPLTNPNRGVDPLKLWKRNAHLSWQPQIITAWPHRNTNVAIWNHINFPWMRPGGLFPIKPPGPPIVADPTEAYLLAHPETFVDATSMGDWYWDEYDRLYRCWFTATVVGNFALFSITSPDGIHWGDVENWNNIITGGDISPFNIAPHYAFAHFGSFGARIEQQESGYLRMITEDFALERGVTSVAVLPGVPGKRKYTYVFAMLGHPDKHALFRIDMESSGIMTMRDAYQWRQLDEWRVRSADGRVALDYDDYFAWPMINQVIETPPALRDRGEFMLISDNDGKAIRAQFSNDLIRWSWPVDNSIEVVGSRGLVPNFIRSRLANGGNLNRVGDTALWHFATNDSGIIAGKEPSGVPMGDVQGFALTVMAEAEVRVV